MNRKSLNDETCLCVPTSKWFLRLFRDSGIIKIHKTVLDGGSNFVCHELNFLYRKWLSMFKIIYNDESLLESLSSLI